MSSAIILLALRVKAQHRIAADILIFFMYHLLNKMNALLSILTCWAEEWNQTM